MIFPPNSKTLSMDPHELAELILSIRRNDYTEEEDKECDRFLVTAATRLAAAVHVRGLQDYPVS